MSIQATMASPKDWLRRGEDGHVKVEELLSTQEMYEADRLAIAGGVAGATLMESAGAACTDQIVQAWRARPTLVLCGPGNNGGDGFVIARLLRERGWPVRLALLGERQNLRGDAAEMAKRWSGDALAAAPRLIDGAELIVDALFGAGLDRPLAGEALTLVEAMAAARAPICAVDVPSGVCGDTGRVLGAAAEADLTVTFFRKKPGHSLSPGRDKCGRVHVADIGVPERVLNDIKPQTYENAPGRWRAALPVPRTDDHKYSRGHAIVAGGGVDASGAARLAARAALRIGAGLVTVACPRSALLVYAAHLTAVMVKAADTPEALAALIKERRGTAGLIGPGCGVGPNTEDLSRAMLASLEACVLDADVFTVFREHPEKLFALLGGGCVLTPHQGEFERIFPGALDAARGKLAAVREASAKCGAIVLLKGPDTVIAAPDGRAVINTHASPHLATAGSGDVLAGFILGLLAGGMPPFEAACAGAWLHGACGLAFGPGLIAEDLPERLPEVLSALEEEATDEQ